MESKAKIYEYYQRCENESSAVMDEQRAESRIDDMMYHGKAKALELVGYTGERAMVNINHIKPIVDKVSGLFRQLRQEAVLTARDPITEMRQKLSGYMNNAINTIRSDANLPILESDQDLEMFSKGIGIMDNGIVFLDAKRKGKVQSEVRDMFVCWWDTKASMRNLKDRYYNFQYRTIPLETALAMFPGTTEDDYDKAPMVWDEYYEWRKMSRDRDIPAYTDPNKRSKGKAKVDYACDAHSVVVGVFEFKRLEKFRKYRNPAYDVVTEAGQADPYTAQYEQQLAIFISDMLKDLETAIQGQMEESEDYEDGFQFKIDAEAEYFEVPSEYAETVDVLISQLQGVEADYDDFQKYVYKTAFIGREKCLKAWRSISQNDFALQFKTANYDRETSTWYGLVRQMREPALLRNKFLTDIIYTLSQRAAAGVLYETNAITDIVEFEESYTDGSRATEVNNLDKIRPKNEGASATGLEALVDKFESGVALSVGLNPEYLGTSENKQVSAVFEMQRIKQVTSALANYMDSVTLYLKDNARLLLDFTRFLVRYDNDFSISVAGEEGAMEVVTLTADIVDFDYDIDLGEAPLSPTMKEGKAKMVTDVALAALQLGNPMAMSLAVESWDVYGMSGRDIQRWKEAFVPPEPQQDPQAAAMQQQAMALQMQKAMADIEKIKADIEGKAADARNKDANTEKTLMENMITANTPPTAITVNI